MAEFGEGESEEWRCWDVGGKWGEMGKFEGVVLCGGLSECLCGHLGGV